MVPCITHVHVRTRTHTRVNLRRCHSHAFTNIIMSETRRWSVSGIGGGSNERQMKDQRKRGARDDRTGCIPHQAAQPNQVGCGRLNSPRRDFGSRAQVHSGNAEAGMDLSDAKHGQDVVESHGRGASSIVPIPEDVRDLLMGPLLRSLRSAHSALRSLRRVRSQVVGLTIGQLGLCHA